MGARRILTLAESEEVVLAHTRGEGPHRAALLLVQMGCLISWLGARA